MLQNFDEESYFQTIYYIDKCILKQDFSLFLTKENKSADFLRIFTSDKKLDFDSLFVAVVLGCFSLTSKIINFKF